MIDSIHLGLTSRYALEMESKLLSFVTSKSGERISLHVDKAGLSLLISELTWLQKKLDAGECDHTHLRSEAQAGDELTTSKLKDQEDEDNIVHHVKIYGWNDEWKRKHGLAD